MRGFDVPRIDGVAVRWVAHCFAAVSISITASQKSFSRDVPGQSH
jgi:hypothetical protein